MISPDTEKPNLANPWGRARQELGKSRYGMGQLMGFAQETWDRLEYKGAKARIAWVGKLRALAGWSWERMGAEIDRAERPVLVKITRKRRGGKTRR